MRAARPKTKRSEAKQSKAQQCNVKLSKAKQSGMLLPSHGSGDRNMAGDGNMAAPAVLHSLLWLEMTAVLNSLLPWPKCEQRDQKRSEAKQNNSAK
jgi:hypothetical protein